MIIYTLEPLTQDDKKRMKEYVTDNHSKTTYNNNTADYHKKSRTIYKKR